MQYHFSVRSLIFWSSLIGEEMLKDGLIVMYTVVHLPSLPWTNYWAYCTHPSVGLSTIGTYRPIVAHFPCSEREARYDKSGPPVPLVCESDLVSLSFRFILARNENDFEGLATINRRIVQAPMAQKSRTAIMYIQRSCWLLLVTWLVWVKFEV